jgi:pilus assembly protein CpaE
MLATNLAVELSALATNGVAVVDLDYRFGQVATLLDVDPNYTLADLCSSPEALEAQVIGRALTRHASGVQVLSRATHLAEADTITAAACLGVFSNLVQMSQYVVADGPTRFDVAGKSLLSLSDVTLLVVQQVVPCVRNALRILQNMRENGYDLECAKLVCNRVGRGSGQLSVDDIAKTLGLEVFASIPDDWDTVSGAINLGEPLLNHSPKSKVRLALQEIAERLHTPDPDADDRDNRKQGLIGRIFAAG